MAIFPNTIYTELPANTTGKDFIVGDIHGSKSQLLAELHKVGFNFRHDRLFSVGDLVDRGPESFEMLESLDDMPWFYPVQGNHEVMFVNAVSCLQEKPYMRMATGYDLYQIIDHYFRNGGEWTAPYQAQELLGYAELLKKLPTVIKVNHPDGAFFVGHASFHSLLMSRYTEQEMKEWTTVPQDVLWGRRFIRHCLSQHEAVVPLIASSGQDVWVVKPKPFLGKNLETINTNVPLHYCGHTILPQIVVVDNVVHLDTGAVCQYLHEKYPKEVPQPGKFSIVEHAAFLQDMKEAVELIALELPNPSTS